MPYLNIVILAGNLTRQPELTYTPKGTACLSFGIAISRVWKDESGEKKEEVTFVECQAFAGTAGNIAKFFSKGNPIMVEGRLRLEKWDDKKTGEKKSKTRVLCEKFHFMNGPKPKQEDEPEPRAQRPAQPVATGIPADSADDDVPF